MKPLFCFYKNDLYIWSTDYQMKSCEAKTPIQIFLNTIEKEYDEQLKVIQINFEHDSTELFKHQQKLYESDKCTAFIFNQYEIVNIQDLQKKLDLITSENDSLTFNSLISKSEFIEKVQYILEQIKQGRIYQVNLTAPLKAQTQLSGEQLFFQYQNKFKGHYKAYLPFKNYDLISFSPELFLQKENFILKTRPIKGSAAQNKVFSKDLFENKKEEAELSMIVDLLRNDLNNISDKHSSVVVSHREAMELGYIQHTYSEISVQCENNLTSIIEKTFPGGSISGCPKLESLKVIREVETFQRQAYTGALGWWQKNDFTLNLTIRSLIKVENDVFYHAGCGIVYDSTPEAEWAEFLLKTGALNVK